MSSVPMKSTRKPAYAKAWHLSAEECLLIKDLRHGKHDREIAAKFGLSLGGARGRIRNLFPKAGVKSRAELLVAVLEFERASSAGSYLAPPKLPPLKPSQARVFPLVIEDLDNKEIAEQLNRSYAGVKNIVSAIYRACGVKNRAELILRYSPKTSEDGAGTLNPEVARLQRVWNLTHGQGTALCGLVRGDTNTQIAEKMQTTEGIVAGLIASAGAIIGSTNRIDLALQVARRLKPGPLIDHDPQRFADLSNSRSVVVRLLLKGKSNREIATQLSVEEPTAAHFTERVFARVGVTNQVQLAVGYHCAARLVRSDQRPSLPNVLGRSEPPAAQLKL